MIQFAQVTLLLPQGRQVGLDGDDGAGSLTSPGALWAWLEDVVEVDVDLLVVEGHTALDLCAFELWSAVVPHDVIVDLARGKLYVVIARNTLYVDGHEQTGGAK